MFNSIEKIYDYTEHPVNLKKELEEQGIIAEDLSRNEKYERKFSPESEKQYDLLSSIIDKEWEKFKSEASQDKLLNRYLNLKKSRNSSEDKSADIEKAITDQIQSYGDETEQYQKLEETTYQQLEIESGLKSFDAIRCAKDRVRTLAFLETIKEKVKTGDKILEAGAGTGILAIAAAQAGAEVAALEINPITAIFARRVVERCIAEGLIKKGQVKIMLGDALKYKRTSQDEKDGKKFDGFISENLYTGQFYELQMQISNYLLKYIDIEQDKIIPKGMVNGVELTTLPAGVIDRFPEGKTDFVAKDLYNPNKAKGITAPEAYDYIDFRKEESVGVRNRIVKTIAQDGVIDSATIFSLIQLSGREPSGRKGNIIHRGEADFLNNDHVIMLNRSLNVIKGDQIEIYISYIAGDRPSQADIRIKNLRTNEEASNIKEVKIREAA
ncbi:MAG: 50S ribosomal protein L11 methyltransferase [Patescibacteria group bacterium]|jgi:predicted RNA methylase